MKKVLSIIVSLMLCICFCITNSYAVINLDDPVQLLPRPVMIGENASYWYKLTDASIGYYYAYSNMTQYLLTSRPSNLVVNGETAGNVAAVYNIPNILFQKWKGDYETWEGLQYQGTSIGSVSSSNGTPATSPSGSNGIGTVVSATDNLYSIIANDESHCLLQVDTISYATGTTILMGTTCGEKISDSAIDGVSIIADDSIGVPDATVTVIGELIYKDGNQVVRRTLNESFNFVNGFSPNPYYLENDTSYDCYVFDGFVYYSAYSNRLPLSLQIAYDTSNQRLIDIADGVAYNQDIAIENPFNFDPISRITSEIVSLESSNIGIIPSGNINITENGLYDVTRAATVTVDVPQEILEDVNAFNWLYGAVEGILTMEIAPGFSIGVILLFIAGFALLIWILKIFFGG